mmetsp:Transcript_3226/g.7598  ORF Transcript_3226/g.7598 Transcript_3226/m.7598 type:complete len:615 (-) Transcript_3226:107-1951(-)
MGCGALTGSSKAHCVSVLSPAGTENGADVGNRSTSSMALLQDRVQRLEELTEKQATVVSELREALVVVMRDARRTVSVLQYNILASYLGNNTKPWFLYGVDITPEVREAIFERYHERDASGNPVNPWPKYVEGILTPEEIEAVQGQDAHFSWEQRKNKVLEQLRRNDPDVISLVENDQQNFFLQGLADCWDGVFHKRPRRGSPDGCGVFWRRSKFELVARKGLDFVDGNDDKGGERRDRSCLMVLLRWKACGTPLVVVSTHLAKDPDNRGQTAIRVKQVSQLMEGLTEFTSEREAMEAPVILMGDLNARHLGEIRGIARTVWQIRGGEAIHKFLWSATDVPTGPTSITKARRCRIDVVQFLSSQLEILDVAPVPVLPEGEVIPNAVHPSDHFPVCVRFKLKDSYEKHHECARAWLECVAGGGKLHPLTEPELRIAFEFFDRDRNNMIHRHGLEEACLELKHAVRGDVQKLLLGCFPDQQITYANFIRAYEVRLNHERMRCIGELEYAFQWFAGENATHITRERLEEAFREIMPIDFNDAELEVMIGRLNMKTDQEPIDLRRFCEVVCRATFPHRDRRRKSFCQDDRPHQSLNSDSARELVGKLENLNSRHIRNF